MNRAPIPSPTVLVVGALMLIAGAAFAQDLAEVALGRRVADVVDIAVAEYSEGVVDGRVVQLEELNEAKLFLEGARRTAEQLNTGLASEVVPQVDRIVLLVDALADETEVRAALAELRTTLAVGLGVSLDPMPETPPSLTRGAALYARDCAQCHGNAGAGDGPFAVGMDPPPADLTDAAALRTVPPVEFFRKINVGVAGTAMPAFVDSLSLYERWSIALFASTLRHSARARDAGAAHMARVCDECRFYLSDFETIAMIDDDSLGVLVRGWTTRAVEEDALIELVAYGRAAGAVDELGSDRQLMAMRIVNETKAGVDAAVGLARDGDGTAAAQAALDAYLLFERIESGVRAKDAAVARRVEQSFAELRWVLQRPGEVEQVAMVHAELLEALDRAADRLTVTASGSVLFGQSLVIILREGLEAILIIGALMAFLTKAGATERRRDVSSGVWIAVGASVITAVAFATMFQAATAQQEVIEGVTMLLASAVLFWVSYWLVSKIELRKWQSFVQNQMRSALSRRGGWALAGVAFLAVYREGFETVLFYAALFTSSDGSWPAIASMAGGIVVGGLALGFIYFAMQRYGLRIPLKPFFAVTSAFLYVMAFSFAGQGVAELQEIGWIPTTTLDWIPSVPVLGIFPTIQTMMSQIVLAAALLGALVWVFWLEPKAARVRVN